MTLILTTSELLARCRAWTSKDPFYLDETDEIISKKINPDCIVTYLGIRQDERSLRGR